MIEPRPYTERTYLIGTDPELFVQVKGTNHIVSAHDLVPGTKLTPFPVQKGAIQPDGTSAEFNIHPAETAEEFTDNIRSVLLELQRTVIERAKKNNLFDLELKVTPTAWFEEGYFKTLPAQALVFGCSPDWNAWTQKQTEFHSTRLPFRTGAGHIHIGWTANEDVLDDGHWNDCICATRQMDAALYFASLLWDTDTQRRTLYGKMGAFRPKPYGVEYRSLSNAWIADPKLHKFVFDTAVTAMKLLDKFDNRLWEEGSVYDLVKRTQENRVIPRMELIGWHERFVDTHGLPSLPAEYLAA